MKSFFYLQRADRYALIALLAVVVAAVGLLLYLGKPGETASAVAVDSTAVDSAGVGPGRVRPNAVRYYAVEGRRAELFAFDPNTADSTELLRLGLAPWQVRNIYKYRASGGIYRKPSDFARLYGLTVGQYKALEPYIRISPDYRPAAGLAVAETRDMYVRDTLRYPLKLKPGEHVPLNAADTSLLKRVPGIGSGFARAIVGYRERLGGYYSVSQLLEISGFPQSALPYFDIGTARCRRLNVNTATLSQLRRHPYIGFYRAKTIVDHRRLHGIIRSLSELGLYKDFTPEAVDRLSHYVEF